MRLIIAGSRTLSVTSEFIDQVIKQFQIDSETEISQIVSGEAYGIDKAGESWAISHDREIIRFPAEWARHGRPAGILRNRDMAMYADRLLLIWDGKSPGSTNMREQMQKLGKPIYEVILKSTLK
jgi:hypothetical protein